MPLGSATSAALQGGDGYRGWDNQTYLLAAIVDAVRENTYAFVSANSKRKPKAPEPIQRPSARGAKKRTNRFAAMARQAYTKNANRKDADGSGSGR